MRDPDADTHRPPTGRPIPPAAELRWPPGSPIPTGDQSGAPKWEELAKHLKVIQWNDTTDEAIKAWLKCPGILLPRIQPAYLYNPYNLGLFGDCYEYINYE